MIRRAAVFLALAAALAQPAAAQVRVMDGSGAPYSLAVTSWRDMPFRTVVRQQFDFSCGSAALATLLTFHYQRPTSERDAFKAMFAAGDQAKIRKVGFSLLDMKTYLAGLGIAADGFRLSLKDIETNRIPAIALVQTDRYKHFVVIKGVRAGQVVLGDPALGERAMPAAEFLKTWNGVAFAIRPDVAKGAFNQAADWEMRPGAPLGASILPMTVADLTSQLAPLYQISGVTTILSNTP